MKREEYEIEVACRMLVRQSGGVMLKLEKNGHTGVPDDLLITKDGKVRLIEFKKNGKEKLRPEQEIWFKRFPSLCIRIDNVEQLKNILDDL